MSSLLRLLSLACCAFVLASFGLFAIAQASGASHGQAEAISSGAAAGVVRAARGVAHERQPRRFIDEVAAKLNAPWNGVVSSDDAWVRHLVPTAISLLVYGFLLSFLARWAQGRPT